MNVKDILDKLIQLNPYLKPLLTNLLSAEIKDHALVVLYPDFLRSIEPVNRLNQELSQILPELFSLNFIFSFSHFQMPFFPFPVASSKHRNKILFVSINDKRLTYLILDKQRIFNLFREGEIKVLPTIYNVNLKNSLKIFDIFEELFLEQLPILRDEYRYLHPLIIIDRFDRSFYYELIFQNVFTNIENNRKIQDIRRFIGVPSYSFINYFQFFEADYEG